MDQENKELFSLKNKGRTLKERILISVLTGFAFAFTVFFYGEFEIYAGNMAELGNFRFADFAFYAILTAFGVFVVMSAIPVFLRGKAYDIVSGLLLWVTIMSYVQGNFLNFGINSLIEDSVGGETDIILTIVDVLIWVVMLIVIVGAVIFISKRDIVKTITVFLLVLIIGVQLVNFVFISIDKKVFTYDPNNKKASTACIPSSVDADVLYSLPDDTARLI